MITEERNVFLARTLLASTTATETSTGTAAVKIPDADNAIAFILDVTVAATEAGDTLDVFIQTKLDGTNWVDVVAFTQVVGNGGAVRHFGKICAGVTTAMFEDGDALSAGSVRNFLGDEYRVRYAITDAGTDNASFTFSVDAIPM